MRGGLLAVTAVLAATVALLAGLGQTAGAVFAAVGAIVTFLAYRAVPDTDAMMKRTRGRFEPGPPPVEAGDLITIDVLGDPALLVGTDLRIVAANGAARSLFGDRIGGEDLRLVLRHPVVLDTVNAAIDTRGPVTAEVSGLGSPDGAFRIRAMAVGGERLLLTFADITQTRLTERMRVDFVANASHELRTPLATLLGFIETLQGPAVEDAPARRRFLDIMGREAARMARLIDDLLSLSRVELDKHIRPTTVLDLAPLIADVGKTLAMRLESDERRLQIDVEPGLPLVIADRDQILQVLHNLVSNALKYGQSGTPVSVSAARLDSGGAGPMVRVVVQDQGEGISAEHLPRLTERFYRVDTSRSRSMGGTGLGLAIAKHIIERHRGRLDIASQPGQGTQVTFTLPVAG